MKKILFLLTIVVFASAKSQDTCITDARTYTNTNITQNGVRAITAQKLNTSLNKIIDAIECVEGGVFVSTDSSTVVNYDVLNSQNTPPVSPSTGDVYLVGTVPTGAWVGHAKDIAEWNGSAWVFTDGVQGDFLYNATTALTYIFRSGNWVQTTAIPALNDGNNISNGLKIGTNNSRSLTFETANVNRGRIDSIGRFHVYNLPVSADTFVNVVDVNGKFSKIGKTSFLSGIGTGTVTSIATNTGSGITGGTITTSGTISADTTILSTKDYVNAKVAGAGGGGALSALTAATATNTINNANYKQIWNWSSLGADTAMVLRSTSTSATVGNTVMSVESSGTIAYGQNTYGLKVANTKVSSAGTNYGLDINLSGSSAGVGLNITNTCAASSGINIASGMVSGIQMNGNGLYFNSNTQNIRYGSGMMQYNAGSAISYMATSSVNPLTLSNGNFSAGFFSIIRPTGGHGIVFGGDYAAGYRSEGTSNNVITTSGGTLIISGNTGLAGGFGSFTPSNILTVKGGATAAAGNVGIGTTSPSVNAKLEITTTTSAPIKLTPMTAVQASALTAEDGQMVYVSTTDATFLSVGFWGRENGVWVKL